MATLDDLFGSQGPKRPAAPRWNAPGDAHVGVITEEPTVEQENDFTVRLPKWWSEDGKPVNLSAVEGKARGLQPMTQIVVPVRLNTGDDATFYFSGTKKKALKLAMQDTELPLNVGTTVGIKLVDVAANKRRTWAIKLAKAE